MRRTVSRTGLLVAIALMTVWGGGAAGASSEAGTATVAQGNTEFALDMYARLRTEEGNIFISPFSISSALAMTWAGARGETEAQMAEVLRFGSDQARLHAGFEALIAEVESASGVGGCRLSVANALWGQEGEGFREVFLDLTARHYGAGLREVDFAGATEAARQEINGWVADRTEQQIRELLQPLDLDPASVLVLTNAIYFKGSWASEFDPAQTREAVFETAPGHEITTPFMNQTRQFSFASGEDVDVLELPYEGDRLSMVLLLPRDPGGLSALEESLNAATLERLLDQLRLQPVAVSLPRFQVDTRFDLAQTLAAMGMSHAFSPGADFSGMTGGKGLFISKVIHQARVEVAEEGTEAAAATAVVMKRGPRPPRFVADHPFFFLIRDRQTGSILFLGRVVDPVG